MGVGEKAFQPCRTPLYRSRDPSCRKHQRGVVGVGLDLHAEAAPDVIGEDAELVRRDFEYTLGQHLAHDRDALGRRDQRVALRLRVETCNRGARLHRARSETGIHQPHSCDVGGARECGIDRRRVAVLPVECDVVRNIGPDRGSARRHGALHVGNRCKLIEGDIDRFGRIQRLAGRLRDHHRNGFADKAGAVSCEDRHAGLVHRLAVPPVE